MTIMILHTNSAETATVNSSHMPLVFVSITYHNLQSVLGSHTLCLA